MKTDPSNPGSGQSQLQRVRRRLYELADEEQQVPAAELPLPAVDPLNVESRYKAANVAGRSTRHVNPAVSGLHASRRKEALQVIEDYRQRAIRLGMFPLPGIDLALVVRLQSQMLRDLSDRYGVRLTQTGEPGMLEHMIKGYGWFSAGGSLLGSAVKWIPVFGSVAGMTSVGAAAGSSTEAMGLAFLDYVEQIPEGADLSVADLRVIFERPDQDQLQD